VQKLRSKLVAFFQRDLVDAEIFLAWSQQKLRGDIFDTFQVLEERGDDTGTFFRIRGEPGSVNAMLAQTGQKPDSAKQE
jgi:GTP-binding protein HflX